MERSTAISSFGLVAWLAMALLAPAFAAADRDMTIVATAPQAQQPPSEPGNGTVSPEETMRRRYPQPVRVGDLIGLPLLDWEDSTIGYIHQVVRTPAGKIQLVVPYSPWFGWARTVCALGWCRRPVAVPLETVAILARQVDLLDIDRAQLDAAPTFDPARATDIGADETITIAITRR